jgi:integrase
MPVTLDDRSIRALRPPRDGRTELRDVKVRGLILRVTPAGVKTFAVRYRAGGCRPQCYTLGKFRPGDVRGEGITLAEARDQAQRVLAQVRLGQDPQAVKLATRTRGDDGVLTVAALTTRCLEALPLRPRTANEWRRLAKTEIAPALGGRPASDLRRAEIRQWADHIHRRPAPYTANRSFEVLRRVYSWGVEQDLIAGSPFAGLRKPALEERSERVLSTHEIRALLQALAGIDGAYADAVQLLLLTGVRRDMVVGMRRAELEDLEGADPRWVIPGGFAGRSKSGRAHVVPLSAQALVIIRRRLEAARGDALFPVGRKGKLTRGNPNAPMTWSSRFVRELRQRTEEALNAKLPRWTIHNLRHTVGTHLREDLKASGDVVSLVLGHTRPGAAVTRIYDRAEMLAERRAALVAWAAWLDRIVSGDLAVRVVPIARG